MKGQEFASVVGYVGLTAGLIVAAVHQVDDAAEPTRRLKEIHSALGLYLGDYDETYPMMSSPGSQTPRTRWADYLNPYTRSSEIFTDPWAPAEMVNRKFAFDESKTWGGFGYNYQYLGNSRQGPEGSGLPFGALASSLSNPAQTLVIVQTQGVRNDAGAVVGGTYTIDPPKPSLRGTTRPSGFYADGDGCGSGPMGCRSTPAEWKPNRTIVLTASGEVKVMNRARIDDSNGDGTLDNGWFNGSFDASKR